MTRSTRAALLIVSVALPASADQFHNLGQAGSVTSSGADSSTHPNQESGSVSGSGPSSTAPGGVATTPVSKAAAAAAADEPKSAPADDPGGFTQIDIGVTPTVADYVPNASGGGRPVLQISGGRKWAVKMYYSGSTPANFPILIGGTNGDLTGGGRYSYRAAISKKPGVVSGADALCVGQMINGVYSTCTGACNMKWEPYFAVPPSQRKWKDFCYLEGQQAYYLNIEPVGDGCTGSPASDHGCPIVMEIGNGGVILLNPGGPAAACASRHFSYDPQIGCVE